MNSQAEPKGFGICQYPMTIKTPTRSGAFCIESMYATYHMIIKWVIEEEKYPIPTLISLLILSLLIKLSSFYDKHDEH